ncbi:hypothetical protein [Prauserella muralis]|uniref:Uncharacterized protein n=1 Tax=Prauserella muralis TaxID=588067 RepID=A0A2V4APW9_9PSEU|nr:hypothetical protein [Prauserella muralis]PXY22642.1 hypothetical protein BAY60_22755 [Prauserella muralis]TWE28353.1 hypothetical protein FHX69_1007 [Prauserella muralis]
MTRTPLAAALPTAQIEVGPGVDPASLDHALARLRALPGPCRVDSLTVRLTRTHHPALPDGILADASAVSEGRTVRARAVAKCPRASVDTLAARLVTALARPR